MHNSYTGLSWLLVSLIFIAIPTSFLKFNFYITIAIVSYRAQRTYCTSKQITKQVHHVIASYIGSLNSSMTHSTNWIQLRMHIMLIKSPVKSASLKLFLYYYTWCSPNYIGGILLCVNLFVMRAYASYVVNHKPLKIIIMKSGIHLIQTPPLVHIQVGTN